MTNYGQKWSDNKLKKKKGGGSFSQFLHNLNS